MDDRLPEMLLLNAIAARYCGQPHVYPAFSGWARDHGYVNDLSRIHPGLLFEGSRQVVLLVRETEIIFLAARLLEQMPPGQ